MQHLLQEECSQRVACLLAMLSLPPPGSMREVRVWQAWNSTPAIKDRMPEQACQWPGGPRLSPNYNLKKHGMTSGCFASPSLAIIGSANIQEEHRDTKTFLTIMWTIVVVKKRPKGISECFPSPEREVGASIAFLIFLPHTHSHIKSALPPNTTTRTHKVSYTYA